MNSDFAVACRRGESPLAALTIARAGIEERFLSGGAALIAVLDVVHRLLEALDGVAGAMRAADDADALMRTRDRLLALPAAERRRQERLAPLLADTTAILAMVDKISGTLSQVRICAVMTKITGADMPEFAGFADDVIGEAALAEKQASFFSERLARLRMALVAAHDEGERTFASIQTVAPALGDALLESATFLSQRRSELAVLAIEVGRHAQAVQAKVSVVLQSLQIGDITRQRIEHVEAGILLMEAMRARGAPHDDGAFVGAATRLLAAQMDDLAREFRLGAERIVATLAEIGRLAQDVLAARHGVVAGKSGVLGELDRQMEDARSAISAIDEAQTKAVEIRAASIDAADDLLGNVGRIGDIRDVKDDMRCLAINAYIKCSRAGDRGRSVAVVAMELQTLATQLGSLTDQVLSAVAGLKESAVLIDERPTDTLGPTIENVAAGVRAARDRTDADLAEMDLLGKAIAENVDATIAALEFESDLGERLSRASSILAQGVDPNIRSEALADGRLREFSETLLGLYTMASERAVHQTALPWAAAPAAGLATTEDLLEDALF